MPRLAPLHVCDPPEYSYVTCIDALGVIVIVAVHVTFWLSRNTKYHLPAADQGTQGLQCCPTAQRHFNNQNASLCKMVQLLRRAGRWLLDTLKTEGPLNDPATPRLGRHPKERKAGSRQTPAPRPQHHSSQEPERGSHAGVHR